MDLRKWQLFAYLDQEFLSSVKIACVFGTNGKEALFVTYNDDVYGYGSNESGCLGAGDLNTVLAPVRIPHLCGKKIKGFAFGAGPYAVAYTEIGTVHRWGSKISTSLYTMYNTVEDTSSNHTIVNWLQNRKIIDVACGKHHSLTLTDQGEIMAWGWNNYGQVNATSLISKFHYPVELNLGLEKPFIIQVSCTGLSSLALAKEGQLYSWGRNEYGELGIGNRTQQSNPTQITSLENVKIVKIVCGFAHCLALSSGGTVYSWGANELGQLGISEKNECIVQPTAVKFPPNTLSFTPSAIVDIAAVHDCNISAAISERNEVFIWGHCNGKIMTVPTLTKLTTLDDVFACFSDPSVTYRPIVSPQTQFNILASTIEDSFDDPESSDLAFSVDGRKIHVHKIILKLRCKYFNAMFKEGWKENYQKILNVNTFSYDVYRAFLKYLYTDKIEMTFEEAFELLDLATVYCEEKLKKYCETIIIRNISVENVMILYHKAVIMGYKDLEEYCLTFACHSHHTASIMKSEEFKRLESEVMKKFILDATPRDIFK